MNFRQIINTLFPIGSTLGYLQLPSSRRQSNHPTANAVHTSTAPQRN